MMTNKWVVWVGGDSEDYSSATEALSRYSSAVRTYGDAVVSLQRDGRRCLAECQAEAEKEACDDVDADFDVEPFV